MGREIKRLKKRKSTQNKMDDLWDNSNSSLVIHYSCESFYDTEEGRTPRVTSVAIRNLASGQTESFSIHKVAEQRQLPFSEIDERYDELEREMLDEFFDFVRSHQHFNWVHWNMRDISYGFAAIEHRYRVLGGKPIAIAEDRKFDLARALVSLYGVGYIGHPRLETLVQKNSITDMGFLDILANIFGRTADGSLKTNASWIDKYGAHPRVFVELIREHWLWSAVVIITVITGLAGRAGNFF